MSLYNLYKKIEREMEWYTQPERREPYASFLVELQKEIASIESRVSQLEKEEGRLLHNKNRSAYWEARSRIHELRVVLGKND